MACGLSAAASIPLPTRWLTEHGAFSCDRSQAVAVTSPEAAAERLQIFVQSKGLAIRAVERFCLVPCP